MCRGRQPRKWQDCELRLTSLWSRIFRNLTIGYLGRWSRLWETSSEVIWRGRSKPSLDLNVLLASWAHGPAGPASANVSNHRNGRQGLSAASTSHRANFQGRSRGGLAEGSAAQSSRSDCSLDSWRDLVPDSIRESGHWNHSRSQHSNPDSRCRFNFFYADGEGE